MHTQKFKSIVFIARNTAFIEFPFETLFKYAACCLKHVFFSFLRGRVFVWICMHVLRRFISIRKEGGFLDPSLLICSQFTLCSNEQIEV